MLKPQALQKYSLFSGLTEDQVRDIIPFMQQESYAPEEAIITEGKANDKIFFIIEGNVAVIKRDAELARFGEGEAFGEMEVLDIMPAAASIKSLSSVSAMSMSNKAMREIYKMDAKAFSLIIMNLARNLSRRLRKMDEVLADSPPVFY